jgi:hypothetical protein
MPPRTSPFQRRSLPNRKELCVGKFGNVNVEARKEIEEAEFA